MFIWSDGPDKFSVSTVDYFCLDQDKLLNDIIIDFYIRYVFTKLSDELKDRCHVFSSFFYQSLTTKSKSAIGRFANSLYDKLFILSNVMEFFSSLFFIRPNTIEDDVKLTAIEKRHARVKSWTKKVDIFEKDFLIIPINERRHWFLAIVCFPGLSGPVSAIDNQPVNIPKPRKTIDFKSRKSLSNVASVDGGSFGIGSTTITPGVIGGNAKVTIIKFLIFILL